MNVTITPGCRNWRLRRTWTLTLSDTTGSLSFSGYSRTQAEGLASSLPVIIGDRPVGAIATQVAIKVFGYLPKSGEVWTKNI